MVRCRSGVELAKPCRRLNDWYRLRDCSQAQTMRFADQGELFPVMRAAGCLRYEIGTCLGPCAGGCTRAGYAEQTRGVRAFLEGTDVSPLEVLRQQMEAASAGQRFEEAAALRDRSEVLEWLSEHLRRVRRAEEDNSFVYKMSGPGRQELWYVIQRGQIRAVLPQPRTEKGRRAALHTMERVFGVQTWTRLSGVEEVDVVLLVAAWFRRHPEERCRTVLPDIILGELRAALDQSSRGHFNDDARDVVARVGVERELA